MSVLPNHTIVVEILGSEYRLEAESNQDRITEVARFVDRKMRELSLGGNPVPLGRVGVLAALNIADELFREREERIRLEADLQRRFESLTASLERELAR